MTTRPIIIAVIIVGSFVSGFTSQHLLAAVRFVPNSPNELTFPAQEAKFVRLVIKASTSTQPCIDELEVYGPDSDRNLALDSLGAKATASSCLADYAIHQVEHLNDGRYGNSQSWIAASGANEWAQIELKEPTPIQKVVFSRDREGRFRDRVPRIVEVQLSIDGRTWQTVLQVEGEMPPPPRYMGYVPPVELPESGDWDAMLRYAFICERDTWRRIDATDHLSPLRVDRPASPDGAPYWGRIARQEPLERVLGQMTEMADRLEEKGVDVSVERRQLAELRRRQTMLDAVPDDTQSNDAEPNNTDSNNIAAEESLYMDARLAKRNLMLRDPDLGPAERILFAKRHPYLATHNYSDILDSQFRAGGGICVLEIPRDGDQRLAPAESKLTVLFDATNGIARDPITDFDPEKIHFAYRPNESPVLDQASYWHLWEMNVDGSQPQQISDGPFHDYFPCPLPDGGLSFISTRCKCRFLCWRPQAFVLFRMGPDNPEPKPLSFANLSEWTPAIMTDGRVLWTRSEYQDKGANFGHTLWSIHPDGTHPELVYGNNTDNCYMNAHEVPDSRELVCTIVSHGGDHNGPIGLIDLGKGPFDPTGLTNITPDVRPPYDMNWLPQECFRDPMPVSRDYFLVSHSPADHFGLYLIDRYGNRELLYMDPVIGSMRPRPLRSVPTPPVVSTQELDPNATLGQFTVTDVYDGITPAIERGKVKYIRVCEEVRSNLDQLDNGAFRNDHGPVFQDFYATPIHKVSGPMGWPSYVAKTSHGLAPVEPDGSANFMAPSGKVLYFEALDEDYNELQRMRSVIQLQPGERRSCIGCHEDRQATPVARQTIAARHLPNQLDPPPWGAEPFDYASVVQPVWDAKCVECHNADDELGFNLAGTLDGELVPASYRTLIEGGWVHYFDWGYAVRHRKAEPATFGTLQSRLWKTLNAGHYGVKLSREQMRRVKCWIDLNCPLWPDYTNRVERQGQ